jgi:hypothetical protein
LVVQPLSEGYTEIVSLKAVFRKWLEQRVLN